jgi:hypothetical protein
MVNSHCNENHIYVFPKKELRGLSPNFYLHVSVSDLYIPWVGLHIFCSRIGRPIVWKYKSLTDTFMWNVEKAAQFLLWEYLVRTLLYYVFAVQGPWGKLFHEKTKSWKSCQTSFNLRICYKICTICYTICTTPIICYTPASISVVVLIGKKVVFRYWSKHLRNLNGFKGQTTEHFVHHSIFSLNCQVDAFCFPSII